MLYDTPELYGTADLSILAEEVPFMETRVRLIEDAKSVELAKPMMIDTEATRWPWRDNLERDDYLVKKMNDSQDFWRARIKEIEKCIDTV